MYTDEQFEQLEQEERTLTEEAIVLMIALLTSTKNNLEKGLRSLYQRYGKDGVITYTDMRKWVNGKDYRKRLTVLLLFLADEFDELFTNLTPKFESFLSEVVKKESNFFDVDLDADDILTTPWGVDEAEWAARLWDDVELWNAHVANDLKQSFIRHDNVEDVIEQLDKRFMSMERIIKRLAITESTAIGSIARRQIFKELGIKKYRFYAREDERTCEQCGSLHGLTFPMTAYEVGVTASPIHAHCRCWEVPIVE
jgi:SPP1 gp7 family putative phage head morphogenesis protein